MSTLYSVVTRRGETKPQRTRFVSDNITEVQDSFNAEESRTCVFMRESIIQKVLFIISRNQSLIDTLIDLFVNVKVKVMQMNI